MGKKITSMGLLCALLISFSAQAINFTPEETYNSVVVVHTDGGVGSGFAIEENIIVTNAHVVAGAERVTVHLYDGSARPGAVIKEDSDKDLALIQVLGALPPLLVKTEAVQVGQEVYAIGAPKDMPYTMTKGIISALNRKMGESSFIQLDASVNPGNSGGPLLDEDGNVVGVITMKASDAEGIAFAIPVSDVQVFVEAAEPLPEEELPEETGDSAQETQDAVYAALARENEILKIAVMVLAVLLVVSVLLQLKLRIRRRKKDEFDFEIEIEE